MRRFCALARYYFNQFRDNPLTTFADKPGEPDRDHNSVTGRGLSNETPRGTDTPPNDDSPA
ncbi:hypothetical protein SEA_REDWATTLEHOG_113 [Gordonia phage RedWattleHog]|uniref:Uncharacterized protein n=1 Tax=Gordonia phage Stormageddon TaxID=2656541 RepID=A0A649VSR0_9CAUD|nr:hypothetical protein KHQ86_gp188 [Gordonia phage Stormageddon]QGJ94972.1 hypothetical protein SEA_STORMAGEDDON_112 [Gordonia phage Stormageddon]QLF83616.1 hypothetical protein SEA_REDWATTLEHOG_113 [Gordonia phage RedWattleHog]